MLEHELAVAARLAREAGEALRRYRAAGVQIRYKAGGEVVTTGDVAADHLIRDGLALAFPADALFSEETADSLSRRESERVWIVDPLDSTSNFVQGGDEYCVSIGLADHGRPVLGVVYNPMRDELFVGAPGFGASLDGRPVQVNDPVEAGVARVAVSRKEWQRGLPRPVGIGAVTPIASMAYKLSRVAAGLDDGVYSLKRRKEWGTCAGVALVLAAGGRATLLDGSALQFNRAEPQRAAGLIAAGPFLHPLLLEAVRQVVAAG